MKISYGKTQGVIYDIAHSLGNMTIMTKQSRPGHRNYPSKQRTDFSFQLPQYDYAYKLREKNSAT